MQLLNYGCLPYQNDADIDEMQYLLDNGIRANSDVYYVHPGDLSWWVDYLNQHEDRSQNILLFRHDEIHLAWALISPRFRSFDFFILPVFLGWDEEYRMYEQALEWASGRFKAEGINTLYQNWISADDAVHRNWLRANDFERDPYIMHALTRKLGRPIKQMHLPAGYHFQQITEPAHAVIRAKAGHAAFNSSKDLDAYIDDYRHFMDSHRYREQCLDLAILAPDGSVASFACIWRYPFNDMGYFEPVGTHPDHRGKGLAKSLMVEGLRRLKSAGATTARVCVEKDNEAAQALYRSVGFHLHTELYTFRKTI